MNKISDKILTGWSWGIVAVIGVLTLFFGSRLPRLVLNNDVVIFLPENDPHRRAYEALHEEFGKSDGIIVAATIREGRVIDSSAVMALLDLVDDCRRITGVDNVLSIVSADFVDGIDGGIETLPLVGYDPRSQFDPAELKRRLESWDIYENTLYTSDYKTAILLITLFHHSIEDDKRIYHELQDVLEKYRTMFESRTAGFPSIFVQVGENMIHDLSHLIPLVTVVVILLLWISFKTVPGVVLPLATVAISTVWSLGLMSLLGIEMTLIATVVPVLLVAVGSAYGIHFMTHYYHEQSVSGGSGFEKQDHGALIARVVGSVGWPAFLAAFTTVAGFGSLASSRIVPVRDFGLFTAIGVFAAFIVAVTFLPAVLYLTSRCARGPSGRSNKVTVSGSAVWKMTVRAVGNPRRTVLVFGLLCCAAAAGSVRTRIGSTIINFFKINSELRQANEWLQENTNGTVTLSVVVRDTAHTGGLTAPRMLAAIDTFGTLMTGRFPQVTRAGSVVELVKRMNAVIHHDERAAGDTYDYHEIPVDPERYGLDGDEGLQQLITQYLMLFSGDLKPFADDPVSPRALRILLQMNTSQIDTLNAVRMAARELGEELFPPGYSIEMAGTADAEIAVNQLIVRSQSSSIFISLVVVFAVLSVYYRSAAAGGIGMLCLAIPLLLNFGVMGALGIRLDIATAMISSIAIGIGIDYIIHFMDGYAREMAVSGGDRDTALRSAVHSRGPAIVCNAAAVALGFAVILFSRFKPLNHLGGLIFLTMVTSALVSLTLLPLILYHGKPAFLRRYSNVSRKGGLT